MFYLFLFLLFLSPLFSYAQECPVPSTNQRDLVVLPDTVGEESLTLFGRFAINNFQTNHLDKLLRAQAVPVLIEKTIWKRFVLKNLTRRSSFEALPFAYYEVKNFILAIPSAWQNKFPDTGLNIDRLTPIEKPYEMTPSRFAPIKGLVKGVLALLNVYESLVKTLRICMKSNEFNWNLVLFGHGGPGLGSYTKRVAGVPFTEFKKLLRFLETEINTNSFLYQTCYAGSDTLLQSYITNGKADVYSFPIILTGLTDAPVYSSTGTSLQVYSNFFQKIKTISICKKNTQELGIAAGILLEAISLNRIKNKLVLQRVNNIVQIRWPRSDRFESLSIEKLVSSAQSALDASASQSTSRIDTRALILDTPVITQPLHLTKKSHSLLSSIAQKDHFIQKIIMEKDTASQAPYMQQLFSFFTPTRNLKGSKRFFIDEVVYQPTNGRAQNVIVFLNSSTPSTFPFQKTSELFYQENGVGYRIVQENQNREKLSEQATKRYVRLFNNEKKRLAHFLLQ